jgi:anti-sigma factor RsiW
MDCPNTQRVGAYKDGELSAADRATFSAHLSACPACSNELARLERLSVWFAAAKNEVRSPQAVWRARLNERRIERLATVLTAAAAVVLVACGLMLANRRDASSSTAATPTRAWERVAVSHSFEAAQATEPAVEAAVTEDPMVQILFQDAQQ